MSKIIQYSVIISLLIPASFATFINFKKDLEYNLHFNYMLVVTEQDDAPSVDNFFEGDLQLQPVSTDEFHCQFLNITKQNVDYEETDKPFMLKMNGTRIGSITYPSNWTTADILHVHAMMKALMRDHSSIMRFLETKDWENTTGIVTLSMGECDSDITIVYDTELVYVQADSTKPRCVIRDEEIRILGETVILLTDNTSSTSTRLTYDQSDMSPKQILIKIDLKFPSDEGLTDFLAELKVVLLNTKEVESRIVLDADLLTITKDEILDLHKPMHE